MPYTIRNRSQVELHLLSQGVWLSIRPRIEDYYVLVPCRDGFDLNLHILDIELAGFGLELMEEDEMESVVTGSGIKIWCAEIIVEGVHDGNSVQEATGEEHQLCA